MSMIYFACNVCRAQLSAEERQSGSLVRCPNCLTTLTVPDAEIPLATVSTAPGQTASGQTTSAPPPIRPQTRFAGTPGSGKRYGFNCAYCSSRLEATESMAAQEGQCPTCGNAITIPILDRYGRLIDPITKQIIKQDPHPVHAYAAAGDRAPQIVRMDNGLQSIQCSKCNRMSPVNANNCKHCGMPFTMEGTTPDAAGTSNGFAVASLVLGIMSIPFFCTVVVPILAVVFGGVAIMQSNSRQSGNTGGRGLAIAGIICGAIGLLIGLSAIFS
jgi:DNA-directed RNA polymerase subunit RPC12/RpoP